MLRSIVEDTGFVCVWPTMKPFFTPRFVELISDLEHSGKHMEYDLDRRELAKYFNDPKVLIRPLMLRIIRYLRSQVHTERITKGQEAGVR